MSQQTQQKEGAFWKVVGEVAKVETEDAFSGVSKKTGKPYEIPSKDVVSVIYRGGTYRQAFSHPNLQPLPKVGDIVCISGVLGKQDYEKAYLDDASITVIK